MHTYWDEFVGTLVALVVVSTVLFVFCFMLVVMGKFDRKENFVMKPPPTPVPAPTTSNSPHVLQNLPYELFTYTNNLGPADDEEENDHPAVKVTTPTPPPSDAGSTVVV